MVKWLELSVAISLLLLMVYIIIPTLTESKKPDPYQDCIDSCSSCSKDNYYVFKNECSVCIELCKEAHLLNYTKNDT